MKKKMTVLAVLFLSIAISAYSVAGTYAKYTTSVDVTGSAQVAKWAIQLTDGTDTIADGATFDLGRTADTGVVDGKIAPGTSGSFTFGVDSTGTEVAYTYGISFTVANRPSNLKFCTTATCLDGEENSTEITPDGSGKYAVTSANVATADADGAQTSTTVYWKWVFEVEDDEDTALVNEAEDQDTADTTDGENANTMTVSATLTATQLDVEA